MIANLDPVNRQGPGDHRMKALDDRLFHGLPTDIRLVGGHHQEKPAPFEVGAGLGDSGQNLELLRPDRRIRFPVTNARPIQHAVAIQKNRPPPAIPRQ